MRGVYYRTEKDGTPLATPELRISATNNRTVYYDNQNAKEAALQNDEIKEGSIVLTGYADGESEVLMKQEPDWQNAISLTAAQLQSGYVCPDDGMVVGWTVPTSGVSYATVNGVVISRADQVVNNYACFTNVQCMVNKGDIFKIDYVESSSCSISFVPFKTVAEPLTLPVNVMNNPSLPDYSRAVAITVAQIRAGYTCPSNGMLIGGIWTTNSTTGGGNCFAYVNGVFVSGSSTQDDRSITLNVPVSEGDILTFTSSGRWASDLVSHLSFVPFKN